RVLARFSNEVGIVGIRDFFEENGTAYMIMDFIEGTTLRTYLEKKGKMPMRDVITIMEPVMHALQHVHEQNVIHRDISPDNIMITPEKQIKLLDFGAAREISKNDAKSLSVILKPGYAPEEQYRSRGQQGTWTDVYALSATMYRCISGITPDDAMERMFEDKVKPLHQICACTPAVSSVIMKGLSVRKDGRYQSIRELRKDLERALDDPNFIVKAGTGRETAPQKPQQSVGTAPKYIAPQQRVAGKTGPSQPTSQQRVTTPQPQTGNRPVSRQPVQTGQSAAPVRQGTVPQQRTTAPQPRNPQTVPPASKPAVTTAPQQRPAAPATPQQRPVQTAPKPVRPTAEAAVQQKTSAQQGRIANPQTAAQPPRQASGATPQRPAVPVQKPVPQSAPEKTEGTSKKWLIPIISGGGSIALVLILIIVIISVRQSKKEHMTPVYSAPAQTQSQTQQYTPEQNRVETEEEKYGISAGTLERWVQDGGFVMTNGKLVVPLMQPISTYEDMGYKPTAEYTGITVPAMSEQMILMEKNDDQGQWSMLAVARNPYSTDLQLSACVISFIGEPIPTASEGGDADAWILYDGEQEIASLKDFETLHPEYEKISEDTEAQTVTYMYMEDPNGSTALLITLGEADGGFNYVTMMHYDENIQDADV
ncbi:MAG: protein kinase, partial [Clostridia bacterium]|nr:protein kinase [Clostridia bacterium]